MNARAALLPLFCLALAAGQDAPAWWNHDWKCRRPLRIKNNLDGALAAGYPVEVKINAEYLGILEKSNEDLSDLRLVRGREKIPFVLLPDGPKGCYALWFRTAAELSGQGAEDVYHLYYGNSKAVPEAVAREKIFDFIEDFSDAGRWREKIDADKDVSLAVDKGALVIRDVAAERTEPAPARMILKGLPSSEGFCLSMDLEIDSTNASALGFSVNVDMKEAGKEAADLEPKIRNLVDTLGDMEWEEREKATKDLIAIGRPGLKHLETATKSSDAEVKWRAEHILKEIRDHSPSPTISAGFLVGDAQVGPVAFSHVIGKNRGKIRAGSNWPVKLHLTIQRDQDGDVDILWNNGKPQRGHLPGEVRQISFSLFKGVSAAPGTIRIDNILLRRHVGDEARPTYLLEIEDMIK